MISLPISDYDTVVMLKNKLKIHNSVYQYPAKQRKDGYVRSGTAILIVRDLGQLKNIIVPLFYKSLKGHKAREFEDWIEKIGTDPLVPESYRFIAKICKSGFYDKTDAFG